MLVACYTRFCLELCRARFDIGLHLPHHFPASCTAGRLEACMKRLGKIEAQPLGRFLRHGLCVGLRWLCRRVMTCATTFIGQDLLVRELLRFRGC